MYDYNKNYIVASFLAREQIEIIRNIRDSNYKKIQVYNQINPNTDNHSNIFVYWKYYKVENDFDFSTWFSSKVQEIYNFWEWKTELKWKMLDYNLCLNQDNLYTYDCSWDNKRTIFYKYIKVDEVKYNDWTNKVIDDAFKVTSKVIWYMKWYHEFEVVNIFTDYKRF